MWRDAATSISRRYWNRAAAVRTALVLIGVASAMALLFYIWMGAAIVTDNHISPGASYVVSIGVPLAVLGGVAACVLSVSAMRPAPNQLRGVALAVLVSPIVVLGCGFLMTGVDAVTCGDFAGVSARTSTSESLWIALDTVPVLKIPETLGWSEPRPASYYSGCGYEGGTSIPFGRGLAALLVRLVSGFVLVAIVKAVFDLAAPRILDALVRRPSKGE